MCTSGELGGEGTPVWDVRSTHGAFNQRTKHQSLLVPNFEDLLLMLWEAGEQGVPWLWWGQEGNCTPHFCPTRGF